MAKIGEVKHMLVLDLLRTQFLDFIHLAYLDLRVNLLYNCSIAQH